MQKGLKLRLHLLAGVAALSTTSGAFAQDAGGSQATAADAQSTASTGVEDIVVTARRRAESLQSVPVSVSAVTESMLREKAISTPYDLMQSTPGISALSGGGSRNDVFFFIRGQGVTFNSPPSVVTYFADVPQQTNSQSGGSNITYYDLESVQVLKGPQGTLFGRSTTGGAVLVTPKKPSGEFDGFVEMSLGNYNSRILTGVVNVPIIGDRLAVRVAAHYDHHDGYARSSTTGQDLDDRNRSSFRISLLARPTDWLTNTTIFSDVDIKESTTAAPIIRFEPLGVSRNVTDPALPFNPTLQGNTVNTGVFLDTRNPSGATLGLTYDPRGLGLANTTTDITQASGRGYTTVAATCNRVVGGQTIAAGNGQSLAQCIAQRVAIIDKVRAGFASAWDYRQNGGDPRRVPTTYNLFLRSRVQQIINSTEIDLGGLGFLGETTFKNIFSTTRNLRSEQMREFGAGDTYSLLSATALQYSNSTCSGVTADPALSRICSGPGDFIDFGAGRTKWLDTYSEEAQLSGRINGKHDWIVGFFSEATNKNAFLNVPQMIFSLGGALTNPVGLPSTAQTWLDDYKLIQNGIFGQTTIDMGEFGLTGLRFTAGYRHSTVKERAVSAAATATPTGITKSATKLSIASVEKADSYTFALDYTVRPGLMVYATTRKGFKQGGINFGSLGLAVSDAVPAYGPEKVTDYEAGIKADYELGSIGARTNLTFYRSNFTGLQRNLSFFTGTTIGSQILNAAKMRAQGIELEQTFRFSPAFGAAISYSYIDAKLKENPGVTLRPATGEAIPNILAPLTSTPKHHVDVTARYTIPIGRENSALVLSGNLSYRTQVYISDSSLAVVGGLAQPGYALLNLRADWNNVMNSPVDASFFVKNLTNKFYYTGTANNVGGGLGMVGGVMGDPRTWGVQLRVRFGASAN